MKKLALILLSICIMIPAILAGCATSDTADSAGKVVTITDALDRVVEVNAPVQRIASITSGVSEIICAFGAVDKIVGRDSYSTFPSTLASIPEVAGSSYDPNLELVFQGNPDIVIGDTMLQQPIIDQLEAQGIAVVVDSPSDPDRLLVIIEYIGTILGEEDRADEIINYINDIRDMISERVDTLASNEIPTVFYEWYKPYYSAATGSVVQERITQAGGYNIATNEDKTYPQLSAEWVMERNPEIILYQPSSSDTSDYTTAMLQQAQAEIMNRPELANVAAVQNGRVYVLTFDVTSGIRFPIGILYMAKWFHPDLFEDVNPAEYLEDLIKDFFGDSEWDKLKTMVFVYP